MEKICIPRIPLCIVHTWCTEHSLGSQAFVASSLARAKNGQGKSLCHLQYFISRVSYFWGKPANTSFPYRAARNISLLHHSILTTHYDTDTMLTSSLFPRCAAYYLVRRLVCRNTVELNFVKTGLKFKFGVNPQRLYPQRLLMSYPQRLLMSYVCTNLVQT